MLWVPGWAQDRLLLLQQQLLTDCPLKQSCIHTGPSTAAGEPQAYKSSSRSRASGSLNKHSNRSVWGSDSAITWVRVRVRFFNEWCAKFCVFFFSLSMDRRSASLSHQSVDPRVALLRRIRWWWFGSELGLFKEKEHLIGMLSVTVKGRCLFPEQSGVCCHTVTLIVRPSFFINAWLPPLTVSSCTVI